ncbi:hypothetical protein D924_00620 [Enterococcus faecalis 06-MB-S-10]|nr:hypothetical protein D924_00620 [Enterococcus faecalis 06-MB-S-10]
MNGGNAMGYTTEFIGTFTINKPVSEDVASLFRGITNTRRMKRDNTYLIEHGYGDCGIDRIKWLLLTAATLLLSGCANLEQKTQDFIQDLSQDVNEGFFQAISNDQRIPAEFVRHVDGDTTVLRLDGKEQKVRFLLIDTPETVKPKTKVQAVWFGSQQTYKRAFIYCFRNHF